MSDIEKKACPNCGEVTIDKFCHHCGQSAEIPRITWSFIFAELQTRLFGFDNRFIRTVKDLTIRPEVVIRTILEGVRVRYFGPLSYYFLLVTIYALLINLLEIDLADVARRITDGMDTEDAESQAMAEMIYSNIFSNFRLWSFLMVPFFTIGTRILFLKQKLNFLETSVLVFYCMGHPTLLSILVLFPLKFSMLVQANSYIAIISFLYFAWACARFYSGNKFWNFFKGLFAQALAMLIIMFLGIIVSVMYIMIFPETMEMFQ